MLREPVEIALEYWEKISSGRIDEACEMLDDAGTWWSPQRRTLVPLRDFKKNLPKSFELMPLTFMVHHITTAGPRVVLELESFGTRPDGNPYNNLYCFIFDIYNGKIVTVREHADMRQGATLPPEIKSLHKH